MGAFLQPITVEWELRRFNSIRFGPQLRQSDTTEHTPICMYSAQKKTSE